MCGEYWTDFQTDRLIQHFIICADLKLFPVTRKERHVTFRAYHVSRVSWGRAVANLQGCLLHNELLVVEAILATSFIKWEWDVQGGTRYFFRSLL